MEKLAGLSTQIAKDHRSIAARLLEVSPDLVDRVGYDGLEKLAGLSRQVAKYSWRTAVSLLGMSPDLIDSVGYEGLEAVADLCSRAAQEDSFVAARLLEMSPDLVDRIGYEGLEMIAHLGIEIDKDDGFVAAQVLDESTQLIARLLTYGDKELVLTVYGLCCQVADDYNWRIAVRLLRGSTQLIERLLTYGDKEFVKNVYGLCTQVAADSVRTAVSLLEASPYLVGRVGYEGFEKIAAQASELAKRDEGRATSFVRGESSEYADFIESITTGLALKKVKPILANYLNALLGYRIEIAEAEEASTDGKRIYLPERVQEFIEEDRNFTVYKVLATHEEAHLEYGSFDFELMRVLDLAGKINAKYGNRKE